MVKSEVFPTIYNSKNYSIREIPSYHPDSVRYTTYWRLQRKRIFEGCWIPDTQEVQIDLNEQIDYDALTAKLGHNWRWIPPVLYSYLNFGTILHKPEDAPRTAPKQKIRPYLSDFELAFAYNWAEARGFSGFEDDEEFSCNRDILHMQLGKDIVLHPSCYNKEGKVKTYVPARAYLRKLNAKPLGRHLYFNEAQNLMLLSARGGGKDLEENTIIYSVERGRIPIKDVNVGEYIYGNDGKPTKVLDKRYFYDQLQYEIKLKDVTEPICSGKGHIWRVKTITGEFNATLRSFKDCPENYLLPYKTSIDSDTLWSEIEYIIPTEVKPSICIAVDNENRLYLAGELIVTHNSWFSSHIALHEIFTDGSKYYTEEALKNPPLNEIFIGSGIAAKSSDFAAKIKVGMDNVPGVWKKGTPEQHPSPLYKHMAGTLQPNNIKNPWRHEYPKKIGGEWGVGGSGSNIKHGVFTSENPEATAGGRYSVIIIEETGLTNNLLTVHGSSEATQMTDGTDKYGSSLYIGCVCADTKVWTNDGKLVNIQDLKQEDGIVGYHSHGYLPQEIEKFSEPAKKPCYRLTLEGGDFLECSEDHPILISKCKMDMDINYKTHKVCTFRETKNIKVNDQLAIINSVPIFGTKHQPHARLFGLLVGDGYIGDYAVELSVDSDEVSSYITSNYDVRVRKEFPTKAGYIYRSYGFKKLIPLMREVGLVGKSKNNKTLPVDVDDYDKSSLAELIGGYFDADGSVKVGANGNAQIILTSNLENLLREVKFRLTKFGIESSIYREARKTGYKGGSEDKYVLYISRLESVIKFAENIRFLTKRKQDKLEKAYQQMLRKSSRTTNKLLYVGGDDGNFFEDSTIVEEIRFTRVKNIEYIGEKEVYNLTASGTHSYLANNIITHNTGGNIEKIVEAEIIFRDPEGFNMLPFDDEWEGTGKIGWFVPAYYMDRKYKDANGNTILDKATQNYEHRRESKKKAKSSSALDLEMMNYPMKPSEMFLNKNKNSYPMADLKQRLAELMTSDKLLNASYKGHFGMSEEGQPKWINEDTIPIREYPLKNDNAEGCVEMFYVPQRGADGSIPYGRYLAACLPPGEKVLTTNGYKNIEDVLITDKLINKDGIPVKIKKLIQHELKNEDTYTFKIANTFRQTTFTSEHPIYVSKNKNGYVSYKKSKRLGVNQRYKKLDFKFTEASKVCVGDWIKVPNIYKSPNNFNIEDLWDDSDIRVDFRVKNPLLDNDFWWLIGLILGDGWTDNNGTRISTVFNENEIQYIDKYVDVVKNLFNRTVSFKLIPGAVVGYFSLPQLNRFIIKHFGKYAHGKIIPEWVKHLNEEYKLNLLLGYLDSDGCITKNGKYYSTEFVSINLELLEGFQDILFSLGVISSITKLRDGQLRCIGLNKKSNCKTTYHLRIAHKQSLKLAKLINCPDDLKIVKITSINDDITQSQTFGCFFSENDDYIYFRVDEIEKSSYTGTVYNFECETNTFICHHITTHNCDPVDDDGNTDTNLSLQSFFIYDLYMEKIVLEYSARTKFAKDFYEQCRRACLYYNARLMYENQKKGVFTYFDQKNSLYLLVDTPPELRDMDMQKGSTVGNKGKGVYATPAINKWGRDQLGPAWMNSQAAGKEDGITNAMTLNSVGLIREAIFYNPEVNADRISAFGLLMIFREITIKYKPDNEKKQEASYSNDPFFKRTFGNGYRKSNFPVAI